MYPALTFEWIFNFFSLVPFGIPLNATKGGNDFPLPKIVSKTLIRVWVLLKVFTFISFSPIKIKVFFHSVQ